MRPLLFLLPAGLIGCAVRDLAGDAWGLLALGLVLLIGLLSLPSATPNAPRPHG